MAWVVCFLVGGGISVGFLYSAKKIVSELRDSAEARTERKEQKEQIADPLVIKATTFAGEYGPNVKTIAGVEWKQIYTDVRVHIENGGDEDYENLDLFINSDLMTIFPAQVTRLPGVTLIPEPTMKNLPPAASIGKDSEGKDVIIPTGPLTADAGILAKRYRLLCNRLPHGAKMELLLPSIATNKWTGDPNGYFAPKRDAKEITVIGQFFWAGKKQTVDQKVVPVSGVFVQPPLGNLKERANGLSEEIMQDLYLHGFKGRGLRGAMFEHVPTDSTKMNEWIIARSNIFRFKFLDRVRDIRDEFATLHYGTKV